jgi:hypothetical protein
VGGDPDSAVAVPLAQQLRQSRHVDGDPASFVFGKHLGLHCLGFAVSRVDVDERLAVGVMDDVAARYPVGAPGWREAAAMALSARFGAPPPSLVARTGFSSLG